MRPRALAAVTLSLLVGALALSTAGDEAGTVLRVVDGDTLQVSIGGRNEKVYLPDGTLLNAEIIRQGYGYAYLRQPFSRLEEFRTYERQAREKGLGCAAVGWFFPRAGFLDDRLSFRASSMWR